MITSLNRSFRRARNEAESGMYANAAVTVMWNIPLMSWGINFMKYPMNRLVSSKGVSNIFATYAVTNIKPIYEKQQGIHIKRGFRRNRLAKGMGVGVIDAKYAAMNILRPFDVSDTSMK